MLSDSDSLPDPELTARLIYKDDNTEDMHPIKRDLSHLIYPMNLFNEVRGISSEAILEGENKRRQRNRSKVHITRADVITGMRDYPPLSRSDTIPRIVTRLMSLNRNK